MFLFIFGLLKVRVDSEFMFRSFCGVCFSSIVEIGRRFLGKFNFLGYNLFVKIFKRFG